MSDQQIEQFFDWPFQTPDCYDPLDEPHRFKIIESGRGAAGSHTICRKLLKRSLREKIRILCAREIQKSIKDSVHKLLSDLIHDNGLDDYFDITQSNIYSNTGSEFMFCGLWQNVQEVKSKERINICYVEEAQGVSEQSWDYLIPTIRERDSEIWIKYNPDNETDPTYKRFHNRTEEAWFIHTTWKNNPFFPDVLRKEMEWCKKTDYDKYLWVWEGQPLKVKQRFMIIKVNMNLPNYFSTS